MWYNHFVSRWLILYEIEYYIENNKSPVYEFICELNIKEQAKTLKFVLLHGIRKTTNKTPKGDLELATKRMKNYLQGSELKWIMKM